MTVPPPTSDLVQQALARATDTRTLRLGPGAIGGTADTFAESFEGAAAVVIADQTTYDVAGQTVDQLLRAGGRPVEQSVVFPVRPRLHADYEQVEQLREALRQHDAIPVAVGSGTINDITKLAAHEAGRPYMVVATAASMDGYAAFGAAITRDSYKQTMACPAPRAIVADVDILARAPADMTASGFGDLLGKITAGGDWLAADAIGAEPVDRTTWDMVQPTVRRAAAEPERLAQRDPEAVERLFLCLVMTGFAMQAARSSRPASGSEHQFSHLWEMNGLTHDGEDVSHGFKVGVGTVAIAAFYEHLLAQNLDRLDVDAAIARWPSPERLRDDVRQARINPALVEQAETETLAKYLPADQLRERLLRLRERWPALREDLRNQVFTAAEVQRVLRAAGCPADPAEIGVDRVYLRATYPAARYIRRRYTNLDLAAEAGVFDESVDALFGPSGFWSRPAASEA